VKAAGHILTVLQNLRGNCEFKGLDPDRVHLIHASAKPARVIKDYVPRAHGRSSPNFHVMVHVEFVAKEAQ
jgi:large subunit ribosomal protein L22